MVEETRPEIELLAQAASVIDHDLSNPLQSLTVLIELAVEELQDPRSHSPGQGPSSHAEIAQRLQQSLGACTQIRALMREFSALLLGTLDSERAGTADQVLSRVLGLLGRRLGRSDVLVERDTDALSAVAGSASTTFAILAVMLPVALELHDGEGPKRLGLHARQDARGVVLLVSPAPTDEEALRRAHACAQQGDIEFRTAGEGRDSVAELLLH